MIPELNSLVIPLNSYWGPSTWGGLLWYCLYINWKWYLLLLSILWNLFRGSKNFDIFEPRELKMGVHFSRDRPKDRHWGHSLFIGAIIACTFEQNLPVHFFTRILHSKEILVKKWIGEFYREITGVTGGLKLLAARIGPNTCQVPGSLTPQDPGIIPLLSATKNSRVELAMTDYIRGLEVILKFTNSVQKWMMIWAPQGHCSIARATVAAGTCYK